MHFFPKCIKKITLPGSFDTVKYVSYTHVSNIGNVDIITGQLKQRTHIVRCTTSGSRSHKAIKVQLYMYNFGSVAYYLSSNRIIFCML